jgi:hypothetical protein
MGTRKPRGGARRRVGLKDGGVVDRKADRELHVGRPRQAGVDSTPISSDLTAIAGGWKDRGVHIQV